jgi:hypothetical protein
MEEHCVSYKAGTEFINKIYVKFWVQIVNENRNLVVSFCKTPEYKYH